jgi:3,5-epimerase/4-reductase
MKTLIIGNGWIGNRCNEEWPDATLSDKKINTVQDVIDLLDEYQPDTVLNAAGIVGKPNVDWCEDHQFETIAGNTFLPIMIAEACQRKNVYLLHIGTGCIFYGEAPDKKSWKENDFANPAAIYTRTKYAADLVLSELPNIGIARVRMPVDNRPSPGNLIDKLISYPRIVDVENSITIIPDMIRVFYEILEKRASGIFHVTNTNPIKHREIIEMYKEIVDSSQQNEWITAEDLVTTGLAKKGRSNNIMHSENLEKFDIHMKPIKEALREALVDYLKKKTEIN